MSRVSKKHDKGLKRWVGYSINNIRIFLGAAFDEKTSKPKKVQIFATHSFFVISVKTDPFPRHLMSRSHYQLCYYITGYVIREKSRGWVAKL
jgi:hypothetical protein